MHGRLSPPKGKDARVYWPDISRVAFAPLHIAVMVEDEQRVIALAGEVAVVHRAFLPAVGLADLHMLDLMPG